MCVWADICGYNVPVPRNIPCAWSSYLLRGNCMTYRNDVKVKIDGSNRYITRSNQLSLETLRDVDAVALLQKICRVWPSSRSPLIKMQIWKTHVGAPERYVRSRANLFLDEKERRKRIYERVYACIYQLNFECT